MPATKTTLTFEVNSEGILSIRKESDHDSASLDAQVAIICLTKAVEVLEAAGGTAKPFDPSNN